MSEAGAIKAAQNGRELLEEDAMKIDVFLVGADYVWGGGERIVVLGGLGKGTFRDIRYAFVRRLYGRHCCRVEFTWEASIEAALQSIVDRSAAVRCGDGNTSARDPLLL